jgi:4-amino-4-deoxy-L-arabinose transferase-like glycosyltransferase
MKNIFIKNHILKNLILLLVFVVPLLSLGLTNHGLWSADEPRVAEIGREMLLTGNWAVPTLNERPFLEEPPLYYGALALTFKAFGVSDKVARIPSAFFAFASILVAFFMANFLFGPRIALFSALILATTGEYFRVAHTVIVDSALTFFIASGMGLFIVGYLSDRTRKRLLCYILMYVSCSLAFLTKGFIGLVIPGLGILAFLVADRNIKAIFRMRLWLGALIFLFMTLPWFIALWHQGGTEYLDVFLIHNHLQRFLPGSFSHEASGHHHPFYYYLAEFPVGFLPWSLLLIPVVFRAFSKAMKPHALMEKGRLFAKCWFFAGIIFLSIASTKRTLYLVPIFAPIAMLTSLYIESTLMSQPITRINKAFLWVFALVLAMIGVGSAPVYFYIKSIYPSDTSISLFVSVAMLSLLMITFPLTSIWYLWHDNLKKYWVLTTAPIIAGLIFAALVVAPLMDRHKSFVPFCQELQATVPHEQTFFAYSPDETLRGAVPFYTGHYLTEINGLRSIEDIAQSEEPFFVIARDKKRKAEGELLSTGRLSIFFQKKMGIDRTLTIFSNNAATVLSKIKLRQTLAYREQSR